THRREALFGVATFWLLLAPMLVFPGRLQATYLYGPMLGFSIAVALVPPRWWGAALILLVWLPDQYDQLRRNRRPILALGHANGPYVAKVQRALAGQHPPAVVYDGAPATMGNWGVEGLIHIATRDPHVAVEAASGQADQPTLRRPGAVLLHWNDQRQHLALTKLNLNSPPSPTIDFATDDPLFQLNRGWYGASGDCRWTYPDATLTLGPGTAPFALVANIAADQPALHETLTIRDQNGHELIRTTLDKPGFQTFSSAQTFSGGLLTLSVSPPYHSGGLNPAPLGLLVCQIGSIGSPGSTHP
ncbi:MAG TPA: hypothetical protein VKX96_05535, partial [Chloroflexota bacterium]|nr:hypothetical protein [Chloroflexota bacterium]